jgi:hypothetical protein
LEQRVEKFHSLPYSSNYPVFYIGMFFMRRDFAGDIKKVFYNAAGISVVNIVS